MNTRTSTTDQVDADTMRSANERNARLGLATIYSEDVILAALEDEGMTTSDAQAIVDADASFIRDYILPSLNR